MSALEWVAAACAVWVALLAALLAVAAARAGGTMTRLLWLDTLGLVLMGVLALLAIRRGAADYLDAALVLGLLAYVGTLSAALYHRREREQ